MYVLLQDDGSVEGERKSDASLSILKNLLDTIAYALVIVKSIRFDKGEKVCYNSVNCSSDKKVTHPLTDNDQSAPTIFNFPRFWDEFLLTLTLISTPARETAAMELCNLKVVDERSADCGKWPHQ